MMKTTSFALVLALAFSACAPAAVSAGGAAERQEKVRLYREMVAAGVPEGAAANAAYSGANVDSTLAAHGAVVDMGEIRAAPARESDVLAQIERNTRTTAIATSITAGLSVLGVLLAIAVYASADDV